MKSVTRSIFTLLYILVIIISLLMVIKPGASIFYVKKSIDSQLLKPDTGFAYRYKLEVNPLLFRSEGLLVYEDGRPLIPSEDSTVVNTGKGAYSLSEISRGAGYLYFSSSDNSDPITTGRKYTLYLPVSFVSRSMGLIYLIILLSGFILFLFYALSIPGNRRILLRSPKGILIVMNRFFEHISQIFKPEKIMVGEQIKTRTTVWRKLFTITILTVYLYIFMEWIFFITKPSFMSVLSSPNKVEIFLLSGLVLSVLCMLLIAVYISLDLIALFLRRPVITRYLVGLMPTIIVSILALLLIDNFTYTIFKFGISTSEGVWRGVYLLVLIFLLVFFYMNIQKYIDPGEPSRPVARSTNQLFYLAVGLLSISTILALTQMDFNALSTARTTAESEQTSRLPNIILLGSDGVNADNMSVYGYERDTTPQIRELAQTSLVADNAFTNSSNSAGSIISIFTSKLPTQTRVVYAPDILTGTDAYQHLPGLLKTKGYSAMEYGVPDYVDAFSFNMQRGFDTVNGRTQDYGKLGTYIRTLGTDNVAYFLYRLTGRASDRLQHISFIRDMQNPYAIVTQPVSSISDEEKITQMLDVIEQSQDPVFVHAHLMGTHGAKFEPPIQVYSKGEQQDQDWMMDFYDDAILSFDAYVGEVINRLKENGEYDNTVLIIYSDHPIKYWVNARIPLIIHFPDDRYSGRISQNVQNLDIAPTILDYLGLSKPSWMDGESLLKSDIDSGRLIFSAGSVKATEIRPGIFTLDPQQLKPPFYQFSFVNILDCQRWYQMDLVTFNWLSGDIPNYINPCREDSLLSFDEINQQMKNQLFQDGFDISSLP
jgi:glucan phosphoethanolaminetransferase (alkaline phosphatase superfamily)